MFCDNVKNLYIIHVSVRKKVQLDGKNENIYNSNFSISIIGIQTIYIFILYALCIKALN